METNHAVDRFLDNQRFAFTNEQREYFKEDLVLVIERAMKKIVEEYADKGDIYYGIHSKSTGIGVVIFWKTDFKQDDGKNHALIVTILPLKKFHNFNDKDTKIIVESQIEMLGREIKAKKGYIVEKRKNTCNHVESDGFNIVFWEGKLYDYDRIDEFILVK